nr:nuclear transport factor 2 family protein [Spirochaetaceae bacterium]
MKNKFNEVAAAILFLGVLILFPNCQSVEGNREMTDAQGSDMEKPIYDYVEGWYDKDPDRMSQGLHPDLAKRSIDANHPNGINSIDLSTLLDIVPQYGGQNGNERKINIEILDVHGNIATAMVTSNDFVDYVHLAFMDDQWWVINVLWEYIGQNAHELNDQLTQSLEKPVLDYVEGWYDKDTDRMSQGLHPDLTKRSINPESPGGLDQFTLSSLLEIVPIYGGQNGEERTIDIEILNVQENIASVKVTSNAFIDYIHLGYWDDQWWVLN